jgi:hypothetical protein
MGACHAEVLTAKLLRVYTPAMFALLRDVTARRTGRISLRVLDWLVTSYAKRHASSLVVDAQRVLVFHEYKAMLKSYSKCHFDPFCRRGRIYVDTACRAVVHGPAGGTVIETTTGQLNFFLWAMTRGIVVYAAAHIDEIEKDLAHPTAAAPCAKRALITIACPITVAFE